MARPFWSGRLQISLVSFGIKLFPAVEAKSEIRFHQISRKSGERIHHKKVTEGDAEPVEKDEIVKGYEYRKGEYIQIEPEEIEKLRVPSRHTVEVEQFVGVNELAPAMLEKPYFVVPEESSDADAFAVVREALQQSGKVAIGKIAFGGREHLLAIAPSNDAKLAGMMAYTMRYPSELRDAQEYFSEIKSSKVDAEQLSLAKELIKRKSGKFDAKKYTDEYEVALKELVEAKLENKPLPKGESAPKKGKIINLMDALRRSVDEKKPVRAEKATPAEKPGKRGLSLVKPVRGAARGTARKSA